MIAKLTPHLMAAIPGICQKSGLHCDTLAAASLVRSMPSPKIISGKPP
jgi:hypothetical protein